MCFVLISPFTVLTESIYTFTVPRIEGGSQALSSYQNKKILIVNLPLQQSAPEDSFLYCLDTLASAHINTLQVIATPSFEDGYYAERKSTLEQWYRSKLGNYILVTDGLSTRKTSGSQQHPLFKWLTDVNKNEIFDVHITSPGYKFFVNETGKLYGLLLPQTKIGSKSVQKILNLQQ